MEAEAQVHEVLEGRLVVEVRALTLSSQNLQISHASSSALKLALAVTYNSFEFGQNLCRRSLDLPPCVDRSALPAVAPTTPSWFEDCRHFSLTHKSPLAKFAFSPFEVSRID